MHLSRTPCWPIDTTYFAQPSPELSLEYLYYILRSLNLQSLDRSTAIPGLNRDDLYAQRIPLPPLPEQRRIVAEIEKQFTRLDVGVAALKRVQANLRRYRASVLKAVCEGRLAAQDPADEPADRLLARILAERRTRWEAEHPGKRYVEPAAPVTDGLPALPEGWCWATLDQLVGHLTSGSRGWAALYAVEGAIFIRAQDINTDELRLDKVAYVHPQNSVEADRTRVQENDLLVTITGANVTKTALVTRDLGEAYISQHVGLVRPIYGETACYLYHWIVSPAHGRRVLEKVAYGAGKPGLNLTNLRELIIALPPLLEQHRIVAEVERRLSVVAAMEAAVAANLARAGRLRQAVLKRVFEGRLVAQEASDVLAEVLLTRIQTVRTSVGA